MSIKAIINNTEKEIEQIKNSDEQDIDYVYSRIGDTEVEGELPISIKSIGGNLADYRIYGNTVDGESVGDRTGNLWNGELANAYHLDVTTGLPVAYDHRFATLRPITINQGEYCLTYNSTTDLRFMYSLFNDDTLIRRVAMIDYRYLRSGDAIDTTGGNKIYFAFYNNDYSHASTSMISNIMLNSGSTPLPYEPYGYKVPVTVEGKNIWNKDLTVGTFRASDGVYMSATTACTNNDYVYVEKSTTYTISIAGAYIRHVAFYDYNKTYVGYTGVPLNVTNYTFTTTVNVNYIRIVFELDINATIEIDLDTFPSDTIQVEKGSIATPYEPYHAPVTVPIYLPEQIRKVGDDAEYIDFAEQKMHRIGADDVDVTLPGLPTIKGTNTFSVNTSIQPSNIYIKDSFDYKKVFTATRTIEDELPLNYRNIEDNDSTLDNYRIYGNTVDGESVGDRTGNLFDGAVEQGSFNGNTGAEIDSQIRIRTSFSISLPSGTYTINATGIDNIVVYVYIDPDTSDKTASITNWHTAPLTFTLSDNRFVRFAFSKTNNSKISIIDISQIMLNSGSTALPYEPYGYKVPLTVSNDTDTQTIPIYLPEQIKMVGDEAEYVDYAEQKLHRVRKNLLQNTATSQTINGVTFTVNSDRSVACNGTSTSRYYSLFRIPCYLVAGNYTISGCPVGGGSRKYRADIRISPNGAMVGGDADNGAGATIPIDESGWYDYTIRIQGGYTVDDVTFKPMIRKADIEDDTYEPYIENTDLDVTLPALPTLTGTNVLSVGTAVQPSRVKTKGHIK